jgi:hypothetical protein
MDILEIIGEDGREKDIGTGMKDGGKTDTEDTMTDMSLLHLHLLDASDLRSRPDRLLSLAGNVCGEKILGKDPGHK